MSDSCFLSVIVTIYNKAEYLEKCIRSIVDQDFDDYEILLVDDGSTDSCPQICRAFENSCPRVRYIRKDNAGLVEARKTGVRHARGRYVTFADADDWVAPDMYSTYKRICEEYHPDILDTQYINCRTDCPQNVHKFGFDQGLYTREQLIGMYPVLFFKSFSECGIYPSACTKCFKKELLEKVYPYADPKITIGEDLAVAISAILNCESLYLYTEKAFYYYRIVEDSMYHRLDPGYLEKMGRLYRWVDNYVRSYFPDYYAAFDTQMQLHKSRMLIILMDRMVGSFSDLIKGNTSKTYRKLLQDADFRLMLDTSHAQTLIPKGIDRSRVCALQRGSIGAALFWELVNKLSYKLGMR